MEDQQKYTYQKLKVGAEAAYAYKHFETYLAI